ncbi:MAG: T9SS type A sorting domain-containing protein [Bacteroidetes bacterium]|nr:T9SS type A sorting domain-containing protein [Bacteroidota bacterium]
MSNTNTLTADIFVTKYDASGNVLWAKALPALVGVGSADSRICTNNGNVYVTGHYNETVMVFGTSTLTNNNGGADMFVAKYDASGNEISAVSAGGSLNDYGQGITADNSGNVFVTGIYKSPTVMFDTIMLNNTNTNYYKAFVGRLGLHTSTVGVANQTNPTPTLSVYPNPFQDKLLIDGGELMIDKLSISNVLGELILQQNNYNTPQLLDLSTLPSGIYFLKVEDKKEQRVVKVIKE